MNKIAFMALAALVIFGLSPVPAAEAGDVVKAGTFTGASKHITTGGVKVVKAGGGYEVRLAKDFSLDGAPDPWLGFGKTGKYAKSSQFSKLRSKTGGQVYKLPANVDPEKYDEIYVWCSKYSVPLGVAKLQ